MGTQERKKAGDRYPGVYFRELSTFHGKKPDRTWEIVYYVHGKTVTEKVGRSSTGMTARKSFEILTQRKASIHNGEVPQRKAGSPTLEDCWGLYLTWATQQGKHTGPEISRYNTHLKAPFGSRKIVHIDPSDVATFKSEKLKECSAQTVKHILGLARRVVEHALEVKKRAHDINPFVFSEKRGTNVNNVNNENDRFFTPNEAAALLSELEMRSQTLHDMALLALRTGLRSTEIFGLKGIDIKPQSGTIHVINKGGKKDVVRVPDPDGSLFKMLCRYAKGPQDLVFPAQNGARRKTIPDTFIRACEHLGLNTPETPQNHKATFHTLRHTFAAWHAQSGRVTLHELQLLMRHERIEMTQRYAHLIPEEVSAKQTVILDNLNGYSPLGS